VLTTIDESLLESAVDFGEGQRGRDSSPGLELGAQHIRGLDPVLSVFEILRRESFVVRMDLLHACIPQSENLQTIRFEVRIRVNCFTYLRVGTRDLGNLIGFVEDERQIQNLQAR